MAVAIKLTAPKLQALIEAMAKARERFDTEAEPTARRVSLYLLSLVQRNFKSNSPKQKEWKELSLLTLFIRKHRASAPNKKNLILNDKGILRNSNFPFVKNGGTEFGIVNNADYASTQNFGGRADAGSVAIASFRRKNRGGKGTHKVESYTMNTKGGKVEARPFFPVSDEYLPGVMTIFRKYGRDSLGGLGGTA